MPLPAQDSKFEWDDCARAIKSGDVPVTSKDIPALLERLQDMNWPGSALIADFLPSFGNELTEPIKVVFKSNDEVWLYWVLSRFQDKFDSQFWAPLKTELEVVSSSWNEENTHIPALYILARTKLMSVDAVKNRISQFRTDGRTEPGDCAMIDAVLSENQF